MHDAEHIARIRRLHWVEKRSPRKIAAALRSTRKTIRRYLSSDASHTRAPRCSKLDPYKPVIVELLQQDPTVTTSMIGRHLRTMGYAGGHSILRDYVRHIRTIPSQPLLRGSRQEVFDWMRAVLQAALSRDNLAKELDQVAELDKLLAAVWDGRLSDRNRAMGHSRP